MSNLIEQGVRLYAVTTAALLEWVNREAQPMLRQLRDLANNRSGVIRRVAAADGVIYRQQAVDEEIRCDTTAAPMSVVLSEAIPDGRTLLVSKFSPDGNAVTVSATLGTIPGGSFLVNAQFSAALRYDADFETWIRVT